MNKNGEKNGNDAKIYMTTTQYAQQNKKHIWKITYICEWGTQKHTVLHKTYVYATRRNTKQT